MQMSNNDKKDKSNDRPQINSSPVTLPVQQFDRPLRTIAELDRVVLVNVPLVVFIVGSAFASPKRLVEHLVFSGDRFGYPEFCISQLVAGVLSDEHDNIFLIIASLILYSVVNRSI
jgi:hypothetical protein